MKIIMELLLLALGFGMLVKGADWFVEGSSGIADRFGVPQLVIGLTIVAMGTSAPEAAVSITAALKGNAEITIGNIVGSNILNILIILGITSAIVTLAVAKSTVRIEIPYMIFITAVLLLGWIQRECGEPRRRRAAVDLVSDLSGLSFVYGDERAAGQRGCAGAPAALEAVCRCGHRPGSGSGGK